MANLPGRGYRAAAVGLLAAVLLATGCMPQAAATRGASGTGAAAVRSTEGPPGAPAGRASLSLARGAEASLVESARVTATPEGTSAISGYTAADKTASQRASAPAATAGPSTAPGSTDRNVTYCTPGGEPQKLDIYYPAGTEAAGTSGATGAPTAALLPAVVFVHGGGWTGGDKAQGESAWARGLLGGSYVFVSINYRLAPRHQFPAQIEDVKCAVRFLRAHAAQLRIDPRRIGAMGASAGGHLVALLGTAGPGAGFDQGEYLDQPSSVQAVVDLYGPADLPALLGGRTRLEQSQLGNVFGATSLSDPLLASFSPVTYVTAGDPPFLLLHGSRDAIVPLSQSQELQARLQAAGVPARLVVVSNAGHGFTPNGGAINPTRDEMGQMIVAFYGQTLG